MAKIRFTGNSDFKGQIDYFCDPLKLLEQVFIFGLPAEALAQAGPVVQWIE